jgi:hypothetical protein
MDTRAIIGSRRDARGFAPIADSLKRRVGLAISTPPQIFDAQHLSIAENRGITLTVIQSYRSGRPGKSARTDLGGSNGIVADDTIDNKTRTSPRMKILSLDTHCSSQSVVTSKRGTGRIHNPRCRMHTKDS